MPNPPFGELNAAYRTAKYVVFAENNEIILRVGQKNSSLDNLLKRNDCRTWAFITAFNPFSQLLSNAENELKQADLLNYLTTRNYFYLRGYGVSDDAQTWQAEPNAFVFNIERDSALEIGRLFQQNAILYGELFDAPQLIWT